jgi:hypothetical protein
MTVGKNFKAHIVRRGLSANVIPGFRPVGAS